MKNRILYQRLQKKASSKFGRITVLTGARQTGKTTLIRKVFPDYAYITLDDPITRPEYGNLSATQWQERFPVAVLDEVQKLPSLVDTVKAVYDLYPESRFILLGSSQIFLLSKIRESLAGRAALLELYPLTLPERLTDSWEDPVLPSRLIKLVSTEKRDILSGIPQADSSYAKAEQSFSAYLEYGSMPSIVDENIEAYEKREWLMDYIRTYLQRDVRDLANLRELEPFIRAQKTLAGLTGQLLNTSQLAKQSGISMQTAKRFVYYLELSYQVIQLPPWFRNRKKRLVKSPKIHFLDPGIQRILLGRSGTLTGNEFESAVVSEVIKQIKSHALAVSFYHLRTLDGREIDLLIELEHGYIALEIKSSVKVMQPDARHLSHLEDILDKPLLQALLVSNDQRVQFWETVSAVPAAWLLSN